MNGCHVPPTRRGDHARRATALRLKLGNCIFAIPCENLYIAIKDIYFVVRLVFGRWRCSMYFFPVFENRHFSIKRKI